MKINYHEAICAFTIDGFKDICHMYKEIISLGIDEKVKQIKENFKNNGEDELYLEEENEKIELFEYRMDLLLLCCLSESWEQNLFVFLKRAIKDNKKIIKDESQSFEQQNTNKKRNANLNELVSRIENDNDYNTVKQIYKEMFDIDFDEYKDINLMRCFVNAIKHGCGDSLNKLIESNGDDILLNSHFGEIDEYGEVNYKKEFDLTHTTLNSKSLNVDGILEKSLKCVEGFWKDINKKIKLGENK